VLTQNEDAFRALDYGADDFDLPIEDEVTQKAGARIDLDLEACSAIPRGLGYTVEYGGPSAHRRWSTASAISSRSPAASKESAREHHQAVIRRKNAAPRQIPWFDRKKGPT
jgi:hypothetical protein